MTDDPITAPEENEPAPSEHPVEPTPPNKPKLADPEAIQIALKFAWHRFNGYDEQSKRSKKNYQRLRRWIIIISMATTFLAVASTLIPAPISQTINILNNTLSANNLPPEMAATLPPDIVETLSEVADDLADNQNRQIAAGFFKVLLVALPLISAGLLAYVTRFESGNAWVGFRIAAESIKVSIYSLRIKTWLQIDTAQEIDNLNTAIKKASQTLDSLGVTTPIDSKTIDFEPIPVTPNWVDKEEDDGYVPMSLSNYIHWRVIPQTTWYHGVIKRDYRLTRIMRGLILLVSGAGAFIAALGYTEWVAVSVAGAAGLIAYLGLHQWEVNYGNYMRTARQLEDEVRCFMTTYGDYCKRQRDELSPEDKKVILAFIDRIEKIFNEERKVWKFSILQSQEATEAAITQMVSTYQSDSDDTNGTNTGSNNSETPPDGEAPENP